MYTELGFLPEPSILLKLNRQDQLSLSRLFAIFSVPTTLSRGANALGNIF